MSPLKPSVLRDSRLMPYAYDLALL
ncbi:MAG: hypothetical protein RL669_377, partial [Pseudomonadota bacterium]